MSITEQPGPSGTYFVRHSGNLSLGNDEIRRLCDEDRIFIHYPGNGGKDKKSTDPKDYPNSFAKSAMKTLNQLATKGGFVWAQYRGVAFAKLGYIPANSSIELVESEWEAIHPGRKAILKSLRFDKSSVKRVGVHELMHLRARRPRQGTIVRWKAAGEFVAWFVLGQKPPETWDGLTVDQQECVCLEFLRESQDRLVRLSRLLMPPGRTLKDIDIYALANDGHEIFAQVTNYNFDSSASKKKVTKLKQYAVDGNHLLYFCQCDQIQHVDGITVIPVSVVHDWLMRQTKFVRSIYS